MTGIEKITNRIIREAKERADKTISEAEAEAASILAQAEKQAKAKETDLLETAKKQAEQLEKRTISVGELEGRKLRLKAKQDVIDACFASALDRLCSMEAEAYTDMLASMVCQVLESDGEIKLNASDREKIGERLVERVNRQQEKNSKAPRVALSEEIVKGRGGFVLKCGKVEMNCRLEALVESLKEELVPDVAAALFD